MGQLRIAGETFEFERVTFIAYHCLSSEADWNLGLERHGATHWLSGTMVPPPRVPDDVEGARVRIDLRSLDEVVEALIGRPITMYPGGQSVCELAFPVARTSLGVRFAFDFEFEWDLALGTFSDPETRLSASLSLDASIGALHPGRVA